MFVDMITPESKEEVLKAARVITRVVDFGTHLLGHIYGGSTLCRTRYDYCQLLRTVLAQADSISILASEGSVEQGKIVLRALLESSMYCIYVSQKEMDSDAGFGAKELFDAYRYWDLMEQGYWADRILKNDPAMSVVQDYESLRKTVENSQGVFDSLFNDEAFNLVSSQFHKRKPWYSIFDGPVNLKELADSVGMESEYVLYKAHCADTHSASSFRQTISDPDGYRAVKPLRWSEDVPYLVATSAFFTNRAINHFIVSMFPAYFDDYIHWYELQMQKEYKQLVSTRYSINYIDGL